MSCQWCDEPITASVVQNWRLIADSELDDLKEEFEFCCWTCLMRWVSA
jgi:hypothetical protein